MLFRGIKSGIQSFANRSLVRLKASRSEIESKQKELMSRGLPKRKSITGVNQIVVVASGKGVNLAVALKLLNPNKTVGLLDTDIFGPSIPLMMNVQESPLLTKVDEKSPVVWRGLMVMSAIEKLLRQVDWGSLDYLIVDTPPGTGDTQLSLIQNIPISGVLLVTTPQKAALQVTQRGAVLFQKLEVPVVGIVENMSHVVCPNCQHSSSLYGHGTKDLASNLGISLLQEIPLDPAITKYTDSGKPVVIAEPDSVQAMAYKTLGRRVCEFLATQEMNSN
ncbi:Cytosolic Fe-S cluster assembly factor NUBP2 homolog [Gryllus bimaculatus]|nr:Cytosolic Fe-S cluster assembly factor NUBP2 homolog [Gryllus bimaculatus]